MRNAVGSGTCELDAGIGAPREGVHGFATALRGLAAAPIDPLDT